MENEIESKITFIQYAQPELGDGSYQLTVTQTVQTESKNIDRLYKADRGFAVQGQRFSIDPDMIVSVFPPPFSLGEYYNVLPHVVLLKTTLPWERNLKAVAAGNRAGWLGVIVIDQDDMPPDEEGKVGEPEEKTLIDLLPLTEHTRTGEKGRLPDKTYFPPFPKKKGEEWHHLDYGESWTDKCMVLDLEKDLFNRIMPSVNDLGWQAHVRRVQIVNKSETYLRGLGVTPATPADMAMMSEVIASRFPRSSKNSVAHLVCLEGFGPILPGDKGESNIPAGIDRVRIVSLRSWNFSSISDNFSFRGLLEGLNHPGGKFTLNTLQLAYAENGNQAVANALKNGLAPFNQRTRMGDKTVSWFHGPFIPSRPSVRLPNEGNNADRFTRYNPDSGMLDVSYSGAWQLGRLLALQDNNFSTALYNWKRGLIRSTIRMVEKNLTTLSTQKIAELLRESLGGYAASTEGEAKPLPPPTPEPTPPVPPQPERGFFAAIIRFFRKLFRWILRLFGVKEREHGKASHGAAHTGAVTPALPRVGVPARPGDLYEQRLTAVREVLSDHKKILSVHTENGGAEVPEVVTRFLTKLRLLYGMPFNYLVPDANMLPPESIRFFYVDPAWLNALEQGALSIARSTTSELAMDTAMHGFVHESAYQMQAEWRRSFFNTKKRPRAKVQLGEYHTGFLLRSQVVEGWPGMEVMGYNGDKQLDIIRLDQVGPGLLLCIFNDTVKKVIIKEQAEALHFGVDINKQNPKPEGFKKGFRYIERVGEHEPGSPVEGVDSVVIKNYTRASESSVLRMNDLALEMQRVLAEKKIYEGKFTSAQFGLQMVEGDQQVVFEFAGTTK